MRNTRLSGFFALMVLSAMLTGKVYAHGALASSFPEKDAVLAATEQLKLNFNEEVRLLRVALAAPDRQEIDIGFKPDAVAKRNFAMDLPALEPGVYTVNWAIVGADGHTVGDKFSFTVDPAAAEGDEKDMHGPVLDHGNHAGAADHADHSAHQAAPASQPAAASEEHQH